MKMPITQRPKPQRQSDAAYVLRLIALWIALWFGTASLSAAEQFWVQIEARPSQAAADERAKAYSTAFEQVQGYRLSSGWYGIMLGPYSQPDAQALMRKLRAENLIPSDSFLTSAQDLGAPFWPPAALVSSAPQTTVSIAEVQAALEWFGFYQGPITGQSDAATREAISAWQTVHGLPSKGELSPAQSQSLISHYLATETPPNPQALTQTPPPDPKPPGIASPASDQSNAQSHATSNAPSQPSAKLAPLPGHPEPSPDPALDPTLDPTLDPSLRENLLTGLRPLQPRAEASGFYITRSGHVLTTAQIAKDCTRITLDLGIEAQLLFTDPHLGIAILTPKYPQNLADFAHFNLQSLGPGQRLALSGYSWGGRQAASVLSPATFFSPEASGQPPFANDTSATAIAAHSDPNLTPLILSAELGDTGGPIMDETGLVRAMLLAATPMSNQGFGVSALALHSTLTAFGIPTEVPTDGTMPALSPANLARHADKVTLLVSCWG